MSDAQLQIGKLHSELGTALNKGMSKVRGRILTYVEVLGLPLEQQEAFKALVKEETSAFWSNFEKLLAEKLIESSEKS